MSGDWELTNEESLLRDAVRDVVQTEADGDRVRRWDEADEYPVALFDQIATLGWYELALDVEDGLNKARAHMLVCEELGRASSDLVALYNLTLGGIMDIAAWGSAEQREHLIPEAIAGRKRFSISVSEPDVGSDSAAVKAHAVSSGDSYRLSGQKSYCEGGGLPNTVIELYVRTGTEGRKRDNLSVFLIDADTPGLELRRMPSLGRRMSGVYEVFFDNLEVPASAMLGKPGDGWRILSQRLPLERLRISAGFLGCIKTVIDMTVMYANEREQFGQPIAGFQGVAHPLADLYVRYDAARTSLWRTANLMDRGADAQFETTMAKLLTGQLYADATAVAMQIQGAYGYIRDHTLPMHYSDGIIATVVAGPPAVQRNVVAHYMGLRSRR